RPRKELIEDLLMAVISFEMPGISQLDEANVWYGPPRRASATVPASTGQSIGGHDGPYYAGRDERSRSRNGRADRRRPPASSSPSSIAICWPLPRNSPHVWARRSHPPAPRRRQHTATACDILRQTSRKRVS